MLFLAKSSNSLLYALVFLHSRLLIIQAYVFFVFLFLSEPDYFSTFVNPLGIVPLIFISKEHLCPLKYEVFFCLENHKIELKQCYKCK